MAVPYSLTTLITALIVIAKAHRSHPVVPALHERFEEARKEQRKRGRSASGVSRKTLYTYVANICEFLEIQCAAPADETSAIEIGTTFIVAEPRSAHRYYASIPAYQFQAMIRFIAERNLADMRAVAGGRNVGGPDDLYYQLHDFIGREPPNGIGELHGNYYAYRPSLSAPPKILKSLVQIERKPSGAIGYLERMEYHTKEHGSRRQLLEGYVLSTAPDIFVITRDSNTGFIQTFYLDVELRDTHAAGRGQISRLKGRYNGITFNASPLRAFSTGIFLEATNDPGCRTADLRDDRNLNLEGIGLHHPDDLPEVVLSRLERFGYQRPRTRKARKPSGKK